MDESSRVEPSRALITEGCPIYTELDNLELKSKRIFSVFMYFILSFASFLLFWLWPWKEEDEVTMELQHTQFLIFLLISMVRLIW